MPEGQQPSPAARGVAERPLDPAKRVPVAEPKRLPWDTLRGRLLFVLALTNLPLIAITLGLAIERAEFRDPVIPVVANATAEVVKEASRARRLLVDQLTMPVRWVDCVTRLAGLAGEQPHFVEIGPGNVLTGLVQRIVPNAAVTTLGTADEVTKFMEAA